MRLIGTAGHIDHGKSALVEALTGIHPSRLPEERARGMTIDLGYASLTSPDGRVFGVVDVPGHERLVRNMVAGATGFELALWVVDAREGPRPQSREHLHILDLLGVRALAPVVTKADLATAEQIADTLSANSSLLADVHVPVLETHVVDSLSGRGIAKLRAAIFSASDAASSATSIVAGDASNDRASDDDSPYLPIDRAFSAKGVGTVVTGTLVRGRLTEGDSVAVGRLSGVWRIRSLHNHGQRVSTIAAGHRVGVNLAGLAIEDVQRGDTIVSPTHPYLARFFNARLHWLSEPEERSHGIRLLFYAGAAEVECRLWDARGDSGTWYGQIELPSEMRFFPGQRFVLRSTGPLATVGGGDVIDLAPDRRRRVTDAERAFYASRTMEARALAEYVRDAKPRTVRGVDAKAIWPVAALATRWMLDDRTLRAQIERAHDIGLRSAPRGASEPTAPRFVWTTDFESIVLDRAHTWMATQPQREQTVSYEQLARVLALDATHIVAVLQSALANGTPLASSIRSASRFERSGFVLYPGVIAFSSEEQQIADDILARLALERLQPSSIDTYRGSDPRRRGVVDRVLARLRESGRLVRVSQELWLHADAAAELRSAPARLGLDGVRAAEFGRAMGLSRKYSIPYVDHLNHVGVLRREGDVHYRIIRETA